MNHADHVALLRPGLGPVGKSPVWADVGAGDGAFTLALAELLGDGATIYTVDRDSRALLLGFKQAGKQFPRVTIRPVVADFHHPLDLPRLDGLVTANALHFSSDPLPVVRQLRAFLEPGRPFIVVEYNTDRGNMWVPHPFTYDRWVEIATAAGFSETRLLARRPSKFLGEIYSAASR